MLLQAFDVALNGVTYIHHYFVTIFPLRDAARQSRAFSDKYAVFVWFNRDAKFHVASLPSRSGSQCDSLRLTQPPYSGASFIHRKRLVSWNGRLCGRTGVGVRSGKAAGPDYPSRPLVSSIHALPLALSKTRTVTGATKPAQPKGGAGLASSHLQAGVI